MCILTSYAGIQGEGQGERMPHAQGTLSPLHILALCCFKNNSSDMQEALFGHVDRNWRV